ncbi:MAG: hypothetical protein ACE14T_10105 [Syntrophales bacterium]
MAERIKRTDAEIVAINEAYKKARIDVEDEINKIRLEMAAKMPQYEAIGFLRKVRFDKAFNDLTEAVVLYRVKENKSYKDGGFTWEEFCATAGYDRRRADEIVADIRPIFDRFSAESATSLGLGLNKIRYLGKAVSGGNASFEGDDLLILGERIPFDAEHKDDIEAAIDNLQEENRTIKEEIAAQKKAFERVQADTHKTVTKLEKELNRFKKIAEGRDLKPEEEAFQNQMGLIRSGFDGYMLKVEPEYIKSLQEEEKTPMTARMIADYLSTLDYMRKQILAAFDTAMDIFGNAAIAPEEFDWTPPAKKTE